MLQLFRAGQVTLGGSEAPEGDSKNCFQALGKGTVGDTLLDPLGTQSRPNIWTSYRPPTAMKGAAR